MYRILAVSIGFGLAFFGSQHSLFAQAGNIIVSGSVNNSAGTNFQPGDYIRGDAGAVISVAPGGPPLPIHFTINVAILAPAGAAILSNSSDNETITVAGPGGAKLLDDWCGHTTSADYSTYDFVTTLTYFDPRTFMALEIDSDWLVFTTD